MYLNRLSQVYARPFEEKKCLRVDTIWRVLFGRADVTTRPSRPRLWREPTNNRQRQVRESGSGRGLSQILTLYNRSRSGTFRCYRNPIDGHFKPPKDNRNMIPRELRVALKWSPIMPKGKSLSDGKWQKIQSGGVVFLLTAPRWHTQHISFPWYYLSFSYFAGSID